MQISGALDLTSGKSGLSNVAAGDRVQLSDTYGTSDNAPPQWGHSGGMLAYWYFHGVYTNAFVGSGFGVPEYGFGPYQGNYQPGIAPSTSFSATIPDHASGNGELFLYYVDGIDRFAEAEIPVHVASNPIITLSAHPTTLAVGQTSTLTAQTANLASGDQVRITQTDGHFGTLSGNYASGQMQLTYSVNQNYLSYYFSPTATDAHADTLSYTAEVVNAAGNMVASAGPVSVRWANQPSVTLSITPSSSQSVGSKFTVTAHAANITPNDLITIQEVSATDPGTMGGNSFQSWASPGTYAAYDFQAPVSSAQAQTVKYQASITDTKTSLIVSSSNTVSAKWVAPHMHPTLTLSAGATNLFSGQSTTLTATFDPGAAMPAGSSIYVYDQSGGDTLGNSGNGGGNVAIGPQGTDPYVTSATDTTSGTSTVTYRASVYVDGHYLHSNPVQIIWVNAVAPTLTLTVNNTQPTTGQSVNLIADASSVQSQFGIFIHDLSGDGTLAAGNVAGPGGTPTNPSFTAQAVDSQAQTVTYEAAENWLDPATGHSETIHSNPVNVTWSAATLPPGGGGGGVSGTLTLSASTLAESIGGKTTLTATTTYPVGANKAIYIHDLSGDDTLGGQNTASGALGATNATANASDGQPQMVTYQAALQLPSGTYVHSNIVTVTWSAGGNPGGGGGGSTGGPSSCPPPNSPPTQPPMRVDSVQWSTTPSGAREITWQDSHWVLTAASTMQNGCPAVQYQWVDEPITYSHVYPSELTGLQITGLFYDPGTPQNLWSPANPSASQRNQDSLTDGSTIGGNPAMPTYGSPLGEPALYVRVGGALSFRLQWLGSPDDQVMSASVHFTLTNPNGGTRSWSYPMQLLPQTAVNEGTGVNPNLGSGGYPPVASEYVEVWTNIPKYATTPVLEPIAWNTTGDTGGAATLRASVTLDTRYAKLSWTDAALAQTFGYPVWYYNREVS